MPKTLTLALVLAALSALSGCACVVHRVAQATEVVAYGSLACDAVSTRTAVRSGNFSELNMVLGPQPDDLTLTEYFSIAGSGVWFANRLLPDWMRILANAVVVGFEVSAERGNHAVGVPTCGL